MKSKRYVKVFFENDFDVHKERGAHVHQKEYDEIYQSLTDNYFDGNVDADNVASDLKTIS